MYPQGLSFREVCRIRVSICKGAEHDFERGIGKILFEKEGEAAALANRMRVFA
jgi:hypothetical protein